MTSQEKSQKPARLPGGRRRTRSRPAGWPEPGLDLLFAEPAGWQNQPHLPGSSVEPVVWCPVLPLSQSEGLRSSGLRPDPQPGRVGTLPALVLGQETAGSWQRVLGFTTEPKRGHGKGTREMVFLWLPILAAC